MKKRAEKDGKKSAMKKAKTEIEPATTEAESKEGEEE